VRLGYQVLRIGRKFAERSSELVSARDRQLLVEGDRLLTRVQRQDRCVLIESLTAEEGPEPYGTSDHQRHSVGEAVNVQIPDGSGEEGDVAQCAPS
jgi:hypothetical protein